MVEGRFKEELQNKAEEVTEGTVQNGDIVTINYVGTKDGVAFDGGTANNYELTHQVPELLLMVLKMESSE